MPTDKFTPQQAAELFAEFGRTIFQNRDAIIDCVVPNKLELARRDAELHGLSDMWELTDYFVDAILQANGKLSKAKETRRAGDKKRTIKAGTKLAAEAGLTDADFAAAQARAGADPKNKAVVVSKPVTPKAPAKAKVTVPAPTEKVEGHGGTQAEPEPEPTTSRVKGGNGNGNGAAVRGGARKVTKPAPVKVPA